MPFKHIPNGVVMSVWSFRQTTANQSTGDMNPLLFISCATHQSSNYIKKTSNSKCIIFQLQIASNCNNYQQGCLITSHKCKFKLTIIFSLKFFQSLTQHFVWVLKAHLHGKSRGHDILWPFEFCRMKTYSRFQ